MADIVKAEAGMLDTMGDFFSHGGDYPRICSFIPETDKQRAILYNAMNNPEHRLGDGINTTIVVKDVFAEYVDCTNKETGEVKKAPRIVLIDDKGEGWACVSVGIMHAIRNLITIYGAPTWENGLKVKVKQLIKGERRMLTLEPAV